MPFRIGVLMYPASLIAIQLARPNAVAAFEKADAFSIETSRKPGSLGVPMKAVSKAIRKRLLVATGDGRYYLDRRAIRRSDRNAALQMCIATVLFIGLLWFLF